MVSIILIVVVVLNEAVANEEGGCQPGLIIVVRMPVPVFGAAVSRKAGAAIPIVIPP
jgi:hypothetical protein